MYVYFMCSTMDSVIGVELGRVVSMFGVIPGHICTTKLVFGDASQQPPPEVPHLVEEDYNALSLIRAIVILV